jgi:signal transduction histidine kinase
VGVYLYEQSKQSELESNRRLQLCIHSITHDLRTPVMGSLLLLQSIRDSQPSDPTIAISQPEITQLIQGGDRLLGLMNTLLDTQALTQTELILRRQPTDVNTIVHLLLQDFQSAFLKHNIQVHNQLSTPLPLVDGDAPHISRVFNNLVSNVIQHNPSGSCLIIKAEVCSTDRSKPMLKILVQDNGLGISPEQQATLFEPYTRGVQTQYLPGLGLGLYICHQVVSAHGGTIGCECLDRGTVFWFTLPMAEPVTEKMGQH